MLAACIALFAAVVLLGDDSIRPAMALSLPLIVVASKIFGLYERDEFVLRKATLDEAPRLFELATLYTLVFVLLQAFLVDGQVETGQIVGLWATLLLSLLLCRTASRLLARRLTGEERCVVIGDGMGADRLRRALAASSDMTARVVGVLELDAADADRAVDPTALQAMLVELDADRLIIAPRHSDSDRILSLVRGAKSFGVPVSVLPRMLEVVGSSVEFDDIHGMTVLGVRRFGLTRSSRFIKRAFDLAGSALAIAITSPVLIAIALGIKLDARGPVLFWQTRVGRDGKRFRIAKFRTMVDGADAHKRDLESLNEADGLFKIAADPRITRVGGLLRRTSLDELPQLWNVLRGEMSLVGPRPLVVSEDSQIEGWHRRRLHLTPGMTGRWQILGSSRIPLREMVKIDYLYVANWSLWTDVKILLQTVPYVAGRRGL